MWYIFKIISPHMKKVFAGRTTVYVRKTTEGHCTAFSGNAFHGPWAPGLTSDYAKQHFEIIRKCTQEENKKVESDFQWYANR